MTRQRMSGIGGEDRLRRRSRRRRRNKTLSYNKYLKFGRRSVELCQKQGSVLSFIVLNAAREKQNRDALCVCSTLGLSAEWELHTSGTGFVRGLLCLKHNYMHAMCGIVKVTKRRV